MFPRRFNFMLFICLMLSLMLSVPAFAKSNGHGGHSSKGYGKTSGKSFSKGKSTKSSKGYFSKRPGAKPGSYFK